MGKYTAIDDPSAYFQTALYAGTGSAQSITNDGNSDLQPDFIWIKSRTDGTANHHAHNTNVPTTRTLFVNKSDFEETQSQSVTSIQSDGFTLGTWGGNNAASNNFVAWQWKANGGTTSSNTDGSITSTVQANQDAGFSIVTYTGTGSAATVGHGLGVAPKVIIVKARSGVPTSWAVFHKDGSTSDDDTFVLNSTAAKATYAGFWNNQYPSSSVFGISNDIWLNGNGVNFVAYCFAEKQGYSKFGKYVGNGNSLGDGPFVYTGFAPSFVIIKRTDAANDWIMHTYKLGTKASSAVEKGNVGNLNNAALRANSNSFVDDWGAIDMLSNGFKIRTDAASENTSGGSYIYMAFAENPFTTSTGIPTTAR